MDTTIFGYGGFLLTILTIYRSGFVGFGVMLTTWPMFFILHYTGFETFVFPSVVQMGAILVIMLLNLTLEVVLSVLLSLSSFFLTL